MWCQLESSFRPCMPFLSITFFYIFYFCYFILSLLYALFRNQENFSDFSLFLNFYLFIFYICLKNMGYSNFYLFLFIFSRLIYTNLQNLYCGLSNWFYLFKFSFNYYPYISFKIVVISPFSLLCIDYHSMPYLIVLCKQRERKFDIKLSTIHRSEEDQHDRYPFVIEFSLRDWKTLSWQTILLQ